MRKATKRICMVRNSVYPMVPNYRHAEFLVANGYEVDFISLKNKGDKNKVTVNGVKLYRLPLEHHRSGILRYVFEYSLFFLLASFKLAWLHLKRRYQVVEVSGIPDFMVFTTIFPKLLGAKVIYNLLDHTPASFVDNFSVDPKNLIVRLLHIVEKVSTHWADHVITT